MSMSMLQKIFSPLQPCHTFVLSELANIKLKNYFITKNSQGQEEELLLAMTNNYFMISKSCQGQEFNYFCQINFELKFEVLRKEWDDEKMPGLPIGIRFEQGPQNDAIEFFHNYPAVIQEWTAVLSKRINQRNFHKLFKAKKKIGKGAFATVYLAERLTDGKMVAVKAFSKEKQYSGDKGKESLENEIKLMRMTDHENITTLYEIYETDNSIYVVLEYLEGKQLNEELKSNRKFTHFECKEIMCQILKALDHLNTHRIIHRDLKPENIMFKKQDSLDLGICDFGLATYADEKAYLFVRCGTPGYVAPEIINIKDMSVKSEPISDVFSAGIIFHHLLLGKSIFPGKKYNEVLAENRSCNFNFQTEEYLSLPSETLTLLMSMLEKNPNERITAKKALESKYFSFGTTVAVQKQLKYQKEQSENAMDIEEPTIAINRIKRSPFVELNVGHLDFKNSTQFGDKMIDENDKKMLIGQTVKKKLSFMSNSGYRTVERHI